MILLRLTVVAGLAVGLAGCSGSSTGNTKNTQASTKAPEPAKEASNKDKIVGTWEVTKSKDAPPGSTLEFTKDGKMKMTATVEGKPVTMEATYTVDGDKITNVMKTPDGKEAKETATITKLTDTELVTKDEKGKIDEFKRKK
jgi:uncharacterized protein (TIGR03066 family)